jgi:hypothetical protein
VEEDLLTAGVNRVLASSVFERTHRLSELLTYLSRHTLTGDAHAVKEAAIGHAVFGRPSDYNAADDNIVRANVRQLRLKLDEYYQTEGAMDPWRVTVPKGSYALRLEPRTEIPRDPVSPPAAPRRSHRWLTPAFIAIAGILLAGAVLLRPGGASTPAPSLLGLLTPAAGQKLMIIGADSGAQYYRQFTGRAVSLEDFLSRRHLAPENLERVAPNLPENVVALFHGGYTENFMAGLLPSFALVVPAEALSVPAPASVKVKDFERDNAVLISGPLGNPWVQLFDRALNFQIESDADNTKLAHIVNRKPRAGEIAAYGNFKDASNTTVCYARLAYLPGRSPRTRVLLAGGPHAASTQAASLFLTRPEFLSSLRRRLGLSTSGNLPWFEAVVEARALGSEPWTARIIAIRTVEGSPAPSSQ